MYRELTPLCLKIPNGFTLSADSYRHVINSAGILDELKNIMSGLDKTDVPDLARRGKKACDLIKSAGIPEDLWMEIKTAYDVLCEQYGTDADVAVRSSATLKVIEMENKIRKRSKSKKH